MPPGTFSSEKPNERRNERTTSADSVVPGARRRDPRLRDPRPRSSFRTGPPGTGRQGPNNPAESGHGYSSPPANDRLIANMGQFVHNNVRANSGGGDVAPNSSGRLRLGNDPRVRNEKDLKRRSPDEPNSEPGSIDWRPLNWTRSGSLALRSQKTESPPVSANPSGGMPVVSADEAGTRKKTRLGWGEGLVKYEKEKVDGPTDKSHRVSGFFECGSAATHPFIDCSSSLEDGEIIAVDSVNSSLEDPATVESKSERLTSMKKLLERKDETVKAIDEIESEFDSLENGIEIVVVENLDEGPVNGSDNGSIEDQSSLEGSDPTLADLGCDNEDELKDRISVSNRDNAMEANADFKKLLSSGNSRTSNISWWRDYVGIKKKLTFKKKCRTFEKRVNAFKYRALQNKWKENLQLSSLKKKNSSRSHKGLEISSVGPHGSDQMLRLSLGSGSSNAAGNPSLTPTTGVVIKPYRNFLKMPAMVTGKERITTQFISKNSLVEDPCAAEKERDAINPWTKEEREIFMDKFATFGKSFNRISAFLEHKTTTDCVEFYYKNHKSDWFVKPKEKPDNSKQDR